MTEITLHVVFTFSPANRLSSLVIQKPHTLKIFLLATDSLSYYLLCHSLTAGRIHTPETVGPLNHIINGLTTNGLTTNGHAKGNWTIYIGLLCGMSFE